VGPGVLSHGPLSDARQTGGPPTGEDSFAYGWVPCYKHGCDTMTWGRDRIGNVPRRRLALRAGSPALPFSFAGLR
jgi:hypothetical protein